MKIAAILPCYKSSFKAINVAKNCLDFVDIVVCVDDQCPEHTGDLINEYFGQNPAVKILRNEVNLGVGGAVKAGIASLANDGIDIYIKIDSDGQMDPSLIPCLIEPIQQGRAQFCKGNRFRDTEIFQRMPLIRLIGNAGLGFITKLSTGYWELFDPTNGFLAISQKALEQIKLRKTDNRYFFETDLLLRCALADIKIEEITMSAVYGDEISSLKPHQELFRFGLRHCLICIKRIGYQYFILEINPGSFELLGGIFSGLAAFCIGIQSVLYGMQTGRETPAGTQTLFLALMILSLQLILGFVYYDSAFRPLMREIKSRQ